MPGTESLSIQVDRFSPVPLYSQVSTQLQQAIESGILAPGYKFDNEVVLAEQLGLSRPTMRRAIQELVGKGLLVRRRGVGTQVVHGRVRRDVKLTSLYDDLAHAGREPSTRVLANRREDSDEEVAQELRLEPGTTVRYLERLRFADGEPLAILRCWLPDGLFSPSDEDLSERGMYELLRTKGIYMRIAHQQIGAKSASPAEASLLGLADGAPLVTMQRTTYDDQGRAVEFGSHVYRADAYSFDTTLVAG